MSKNADILPSRDICLGFTAIELPWTRSAQAGQPSICSLIMAILVSMLIGAYARTTNSIPGDGALTA